MRAAQKAADIGRPCGALHFHRIQCDQRIGYRRGTIADRSAQKQFCAAEVAYSHIQRAAPDDSAAAAHKTTDMADLAGSLNRVNSHIRRTGGKFCASLPDETAGIGFPDGIQGQLS